MSTPTHVHSSLLTSLALKDTSPTMTLPTLPTSPFSWAFFTRPSGLRVPRPPAALFAAEPSLLCCVMVVMVVMMVMVVIR